MDTTQEQEKVFLKQYIVSACPKVNKDLREGSEENIEIFDNLFSIGKIPSRLFRLLPKCYVKLSNNHYSDKGYLSCSDDIDKAISHYSAEDLACFVIHLPSRTSRIVVNELFLEQNDEGEYILPRGMELVVSSSQQFVTDNDLGEFITIYEISESIKTLRSTYNINSITLYNLSLTYYHASIEDYEIGETYSTGLFIGNTTRYHSSLDKAAQQTDLLLDEQRPEGYDSRLKSLYIFQDVKHCARYAKSLHKQNIKLYAIEPTSKVYGGFPMLLVHQAHNEKDKNKRAKIIREYWSPKYSWKFNEYLTQSMKIIDVLELSTTVCSMEYDYDQKLFQTFLEELNQDENTP